MNDNKDICEPLKIRRLDINDRISNFNCGDEDFNDFILNESQLYRGEMLAVDAYIEAIPFYLKNSFLELTKNDEDATHTRLLYYDFKMMSL